MKGIIDIYCDMEFWRSFMDSCSINYAINATREEWSEIESKRFLYRRLVEDTFLHLKCSEKELDEELEREDRVYDEAMRVLSQKQVERTGGNNRVLDCSFDYENNSFPSLDANAIYLTNDFKTRELIEKKGRLVVSLSDLSSSRFNIEKPLQILKNQRIDWKRLLKQARHSCCSLIVCDTYILNNTDDNLFPILDALIPEDIDEPFQLTIITLEGDSFGLGEQLRNYYDIIPSYLRQCGKKTSIELTLVRAYKSQQHDRKILSNNVYIDCPGGFDLIDKKTKKASKQTTVTISFPKFSNPRDFETYYNVIELATRIIKSNYTIPENNDIKKNPALFNRILSQII